MRRQEVTGSEWLIPASRHKSKGEFLLPLSKAALDVLGSMPVIGTEGWVFTTDGERPIAGFPSSSAGSISMCSPCNAKTTPRPSRCRGGPITICDARHAH